MRTQEEIVKKLEERKKEKHFLDFFPEAAIGYLTFEQAKSFLSFEKKSVEEVCEEWTIDSLTKEAVLADAKSYMKFAWDKVQDHRGISASRSVQKMKAWLWLLGIEDNVDWEAYENYGAPILKQVCELLDFPIPQDEDLQRMMQGKQCVPDCDMGCGS